MKQDSRRDERFPNLVYVMWNNKDSILSLAKKLDIAPQTLSRRLSGEREFTLSEIKKLIEIYQKPFEELFFEESTENKK